METRPKQDPIMYLYVTIQSSTPITVDFYYKHYENALTSENISLENINNVFAHIQSQMSHLFTNTCSLFWKNECWVQVDFKLCKKATDGTEEVILNIKQDEIYSGDLKKTFKMIQEQTQIAVGTNNQDQNKCRCILV